MLIAIANLPAFAGPFEDAVAQFANDSFSDTEAAVGALAASGNPQAYPVISALQEGRLLADPATKAVLIRQADGKIVDAVSGSAVAAPPRAGRAVGFQDA